ncbi:hypothetical protein FOL47_003157 [Perkinsus chesapeaki]|uniref:Uncharacterized protein n=1 Tax=Perkinsus chesapeaki TaxID=330153 RepID=A0A7J6MAX7_PERCH|nr:hypothetical protein FOL47_003157 [Perkinsus chesapeaki]
MTWIGFYHRDYCHMARTASFIIIFSPSCGLLSNEDDLCPPQAIDKRRNSPRFLLLHGWLQDHTAWGHLPRQLIQLYGGEVIMLGSPLSSTTPPCRVTDFFGMGKSPDPPAVEDLTPDLLLQQVECCIEMAGWKEEPSSSTIVASLPIYRSRITGLFGGEVVGPLG